MSRKGFSVGFGLVGLLSLAMVSASGAALELRSLKPGKVTLKSAGKLAFGPDGILFVGDSIEGKIVALDTQDATPPASVRALDVKGLNTKVAAVLGTTPERLIIDDVVVNPISKKIYISASPGRGPDALPVILRMDSAGKLSEVSLDNIHYSVSVLPDPIAADARPVRDDGSAAARKKAQQPLYSKVNTSPMNSRGDILRQYAISDMAYSNGNLYVAGLSNEEFSSTFRVIPFPFQEAVQEDSGVLIFHTSDGQFETNSPIHAFAITKLGNEPTIFAAYSCSPLVKIPMAQITPGHMVRGATVTELGGGSTPLDMVVYRKGTKSFLLVASTRSIFNSVQRIPLDGMERANELTSGIADSAGVPFEVVPGLEKVVQLDTYDDNNVMLLSDVNGSLDLSTISNP